jgi:hypothetical protein
MSQLTDPEVMYLFPGEEVVATPAPKYAVGGATFDNNDEPGFAEGDPLAANMRRAEYRTDLSVSPMMEGGRRRKKRRSVRKRKQKGGSKKQPRFQLTMKATVRLRSRQRQQK